MKIRYFKKVLHESSNWRLNANGGDYDEAAVIAVAGNKTIAGKYTSSSDFNFCRGCGSYLYDDAPECCERYVGPVYDGSKSWEKIDVKYPNLLLPV